MSRRSQLALAILGLTLLTTGLAATWPVSTLDHPPSGASRLVAAGADRTAAPVSPVAAVLAEPVSVRPSIATRLYEDTARVPTELTSKAMLDLPDDQIDGPLGSTSANCRTPRSLMLHSHYGVERMQALANGIIAADMQTLTYQDILEGLRRGECPSENGIVVSLDDVSTSWIDPIFKEMIGAFTERGLVLVVAVIVREPQDPEAWTYLRALHELGVEIASHTLDHPNLPELSQIEMEEQISGSYRAICKNQGVCPVSLVVPYGSMDYGGRIMQAAWEYSFVVGIAGGLTISGTPPYYVGRAGPNVHSIDLTMQVLDVAFGS